MDFQQESEAELIANIIATFPQEMRGPVEQALQENRGMNLGTPNPETGARLGELMARRQARVTGVSDTLSEAEREALERRRARSIQVLFAFSGEVSTSDAPRVSVYRSPGDDGAPLVLLRADATVEDLDAGIRAAALSVARDGVSPTIPSRRPVDARSDAKPITDSQREVFADVQAGRFIAVEREVSGVGKLRAATVRTSLPEDIRR